MISLGHLRESLFLWYLVVQSLMQAPIILIATRTNCLVWSDRNFAKNRIFGFWDHQRVFDCLDASISFSDKMGNGTWSREFWDGPGVTPKTDDKPTFDPMFGFEDRGRKPRVMTVSAEVQSCLLKYYTPVFFVRFFFTYLFLFLTGFSLFALCCV